MLRPLQKVVCPIFLLVLFFIPVSYSSIKNFELPEGLVWFNSDRPVKLNDLKGKFVLVYFWNYGGRNLQSVFDQYKELQDNFPNELVTIGIHSGIELDADSLNSRVAQEIGIRKITSPVAVDPDMQAIKAFRQDRWPVTFLFAPDGTRLLTHTGEGDIFSVLSRLIAKKIPKYKETISRAPMVFQTPGTVLSDVQASKLSVASENLAQKALGQGLMGETVLDLPDQSVVIETEPPVSYPNDELDRGAVHTYPNINFDEKDFAGQTVAIDREYSKNIGKINLDVQLPKYAKWQSPGQSYVRVFTGDGEVLFESLICDPTMELQLLINRQVTSDKVFVELMIYYTVDSPKMLHVMKPLVFKVPLADHPKHEDIRIRHNIPSEQ